MNGSLKRLAGRQLWLTGALVAAVAAVAGAAVLAFYPRRPMLDVRYDGIKDEVSLFHADNQGASPITLGIEKFVVSTLKFGKVGFDQFEVQFAENSVLVAGHASAGIAIAAPAGTRPYLCSQLRSAGFFRDYGPLSNGRLAERFSAERAKQIASDLRCSFTISEAGPPDRKAAEHDIRSACEKVGWINDCVATALSSAD